MTRFLVGLLVGVLLGGGGTYLVLTHQRGGAVAVASAVGLDAGVADPSGKKKKGRGGVRRPGGTFEGGESGDVGDEPIPELSAADLAQGAEGDSLKPGTRAVDLSAGAAEARDLTQAEIDGSFRPAASGITDCITQARGAAPVQGRISVGVVVDADGKVTRSRVEAPAWLLHHGLYRCVRREVGGLRFPAVGRDTVVTVPFDLQ